MNRGAVMDLSHLGGHLNKTHIDTGAITWLRQNTGRPIPYFLDVGCSVGGNLDIAESAGYIVYGIEGDYSLLQAGKVSRPHRVVFTDFTKTWFQFQLQFDVIWCVEVAEHIPEEFCENMLKTFSDNLLPEGRLVFTSNDGPGINHVNRKPESWWMEKMCQHGLKKNEYLTGLLRKNSTMERDFIRSSGSVFTFS